MKTIATLVFIAFSSLNLFAQPELPEPVQKYSWLNLSIGGGTNGLAAEGSFAAQAGNGLFKTRFLYTEEFNILSFSKKVWDVGVMYGFVSKPNKLVIAGTVGLGLTGGIDKGEQIPGQPGDWFGPYYEKDPFLTIGIPAEVGAYLRITRGFGVGLNLYGNLNPKIPVAGISLGLQIGRTWD